MESSYHGEVSFGREKGSGSSSRKGKKNNRDRPKQPQRGLGVAQLEKIRLHGQMGYAHHPSFQTHFSSCYNNEDMGILNSTPSSSSSPSHGYYPNTMMGQGEYDQRANLRYGDSQITTAGTERWSSNYDIVVQSNMTLFNPHVEDLMQNNRKWQYTTDIEGLNGRNSEASDAEEVDLELRLSL